jgi:hypothetical protein
LGPIDSGSGTSGGRTTSTAERCTIGCGARLLYDGQRERCTLFDINYRPQPMSVEELRAGLHDLGVRAVPAGCGEGGWIFLIHPA